MNIGYFPDFKGAQTVLLCGLPTELADLKSQVRAFARSERTELPIHEVATVSSKHPVQLVLSKHPTSTAGFHWVCSADALSTVEGKLAPLIRGTPGHQYFDLAQVGTQLMVSVGEFDDAWWVANG